MSRHRLAGPSAVIALVAIGLTAVVWVQPAGRRLATIAALRQFPGYFHLQNVVLRGELVEGGGGLVLRADDLEMRVRLNDVSARDGAVEVRGQMLDIGRLDANDPRAAPFTEGRDSERWPRPGEELVLNVTAVSEAQPATSPSVRALALEPWKFDGQTVTVTGSFRGRNLFGDLPDAPGKSRYDFILRSADGAIWVTGLRPRGRGFDLDVERRMDTGGWLEVTGVVSRVQGLVTIAATSLAEADEPESLTFEEAPPPLPPSPLEVVFSAPTEGEIEVSGDTTVRVQFSRGLDESTIDGQIRVSYLGAPAAPGDPAGPAFETQYDGANRAIAITFTEPLEPFRTLKVELLDGLKAFDGGAFQPWSLTFSIGG